MASDDLVGNVDEEEEETSSSSDGEDNEAHSDDDDSSSNSSSEEEEKKENEGSDDDSKENSGDDDGADEETSSEQDDIQEAEEVDEAEAIEIDDDDNDDDDKVIAMAIAGAMEAVDLAATKVAMIPPPMGLLQRRPSLSIGSGGSKMVQKKMPRIKLSLKLPTQAITKRKLPTMAKSASTATQESEEEEGDDDDEVKAMVVDSDEVADAVAVPTSPIASVKESKPKFFKKSLPISKAATGTASKRRSFLPSKQIRLPPITSPGLLMLRPPPGSGQGPKQAAAAATMAAAAAAAGTGLLTPQQIFDTTMSSAGYTPEQRAAHPHRGSSVERTIGDIFDTNVKMALHKPALVPEELWNGTVKKEGPEEGSSLTLPQLLIQGLEETKQKQQHMHAEKNGESSRKRRRFSPCRLRDMFPVSLTIPYPEEYIKKRLDYVEDVKSRENAIVQWQTAQEELEIAREEYDHRDFNAPGSDAAVETNGTGGPRPSFNNPVTIPPIPEPPEPPHLHDLVAPPEENEPSRSTATSVPTYYYLDDGGSSADSQHPIYLPKGKEDFVAHLDKNCFHITDGRYFGLQTNRIADPNFVGPNAPGLAAMSATGSGGGLATATTSTTTSTSGLTGGGMTMILSASFHSAAAIPPNKDENTTAIKVKSPSAARDDSGGNSSSSKTAKSSPMTPRGASPSSATGEPAKPEELVVSAPPTPSENPPEAASITSGSASDLRKIMEDEASKALAETFKDWIIRAAVHSGRTHQKEASFRGPNGETYPDLGKAFALYGGVKPCERCKNNKQGVFHCRVRRRHKEPDYDGGSSTDVLKPLFDAPLETLLLGGEP